MGSHQRQSRKIMRRRTLTRRQRNEVREIILTPEIIVAPNVTLQAHQLADEEHAEPGDASPGPEGGREEVNEVATEKQGDGLLVCSKCHKFSGRGLYFHQRYCRG